MEVLICRNTKFDLENGKKQLLEACTDMCEKIIKIQDDVMRVAV